MLCTICPRGGSHDKNHPGHAGWGSEGPTSFRDGGGGLPTGTDPLQSAPTIHGG